ncbi:hypothetical protein Pla163_31230 [Planctomycetes bacterium Pla163]|uniref:Uncharacterized protein n=1 Tax=Rohdeia mirabilis TaxID=2528008 RepID=A0A518D3C3_9BACT|nr:hypothetical protein Pla163_31230 [Planctomycetes bacterium Pla163]
MFEWSGDLGGPGHIWVDAPAPELAQDEVRRELPSVETERDPVEVAAPVSTSADASQVAAPARPSRLEIEVRVPQELLAWYRGEERPAPAWLRVEPGPTGGWGRLVGERGSRGWTWDVELIDSDADVAHLEIELPGAARVVRDVALAPGRTRVDIDLAEELGASLALVLRFDETVLEWVEERLDRAESAVADSEPAGWVELVAAGGAGEDGEASAVAWAPLESTRFAKRADDELELAAAHFVHVPPGTYDVRVRGALGPFVRLADDSQVVVGTEHVEATLALELAVDLVERAAGVAFELIGLGVLPQTVDLVTYGGLGGDGRRAGNLWHRTTLPVDGTIARWRPADFEELVAARAMLVVPDVRPTFFDVAELFDRAYGDFGTGTVPVHLVAGAGGVVFGWGRAGSDRAGPLAGLRFEVEGGSQVLGPFGLCEVQFDHAREFDRTTVRSEPLLDAEGHDHFHPDVELAPGIVVHPTGCALSRCTWGRAARDRRIRAGWTTARRADSSRSGASASRVRRIRPGARPRTAPRPRARGGGTRPRATRG